MNRRVAGVALASGAVTSVLVAAPAQAAVDATAAAAKATYVTGTSVSTPFGPVQVRIKVKAGRVTKATAITYPTGDHRSAQINAYAVPQLQQQAVAAQSASLDGVSGASWTTYAFQKSLQSALLKAGLTRQAA